MRNSLIWVPLAFTSVHVVHPIRTIGVEVSHDDVITEVKNMVKVWCEIGGTAGYKGDVNVMNVGGDIVDGGCIGEVLSDRVVGEKGVGGDADEGDGEKNEGDKSFTTGVIRTVPTDNGVVWERVCW